MAYGFSIINERQRETNRNKDKQRDTQRDRDCERGAKRKKRDKENTQKQRHTQIQKPLKNTEPTIFLKKVVLTPNCKVMHLSLFSGFSNYK